MTNERKSRSKRNRSKFTKSNKEIRTMGYGMNYTKEMRSFISANYKGISSKSLAERFNERFGTSVTECMMKSYKGNHKLSSGLDGRFKKGQQPHNKGVKMPKEVYEKAKHTMFKKGIIPPNHKPVGTESVRNNHKKGEFYVYVKVAEPNIWRMKHVLEWEKHYGKKTKGKVIIFLDGNPLNTHVSNLELIDRSTHLRMNKDGLRYENQEATKAGIGLAQYIEKVSSAKKKI